jgi:hypothetical protein
MSKFNTRPQNRAFKAFGIKVDARFGESLQKTIDWYEEFLLKGKKGC